MSVVAERQATRKAAPGKAGGQEATQSIGLLLRMGLFGLRSSFKSTLARWGVPWSAWYYLRVLSAEDGLSQRELTERVGAMQPNTVSALRGMESAGLVSVEPDERDRRGTRIWLTPKSQRILKHLLPELIAAERDTALKGFTAPEEAELRRLLNKLCDNYRRAPYA